MGVRIEWDPPKEIINRERHKVSFGIVTLDFLAGAIVRPAKKGRLQALGFIDEKAYSLIFSPLGSEAVSLISLRVASKKERALL